MQRPAQPNRASRPDVAELTLRFGRIRLQARVYWLAAESAPALTVLLPGTEQQAASADVLSRGLCTGATSVVLALSGAGQLDRRELMAGLEWASEHGAELGADASRLVVAGHGDGGAAAAWLALSAHEHEWPSLLRQVLLHPEFTGARPLPRSVEGVVPATIVSCDPADDGGRYAARLRQVGVDVDELHRARGVLESGNAVRSELFTELARSIQGLP